MADQTVVVRLVVRSAEYHQGLSQAAASTRSFAKQTESGARRAGDATKGLGLASAAAGKMILLGVGGAMAVSAKAAIDFESSLTGVAKTTNLAGPELEAFGDAIRNLALTELPTNVNTLNRIAELGGQLGIETQNIVGFTKTIANLGETTNLSFEQAATGIARFGNIMGTQESDLERVGSAIVELGNNYATTESEILTFATRIAPTGAAIGATEDQVLGIAAALSSVGVPAERGGTAIQRVFIKMKQAVDSGGESLDAFSEIAGTTSEEFASVFRADPSQAFTAFVSGLDDISESGENVFLALENVGLSEQRTVQALLAAAGASDMVEQAVDDAARAFEENTALQDEAALRYGTTASQLQFLANSFNDLKIEAGKAILGSGGLQFAVDVMREMFSIVSDNLGNLGQFSAILGGLAALKIAQGLTGMFANISGSITKMGDARRNLSGMAGHARLATIAVGGLNIAMNVAGIVAGIAAAAWANQAIKAATLRAEVRQLNEEIKGGKDPVEAWVSAMSEEGGLLTTQNMELLNALGISIEDVAEAAFQGKNPIRELMESAENFTIGNAGRELSEWEQAILRIEEAGLGEGAAFVLNADTGEYERGMSSGSVALRNLMEDTDHAIELTDALFATRRAEIVSSIISLQEGVGKTNPELNEMADNLVDIFGLDVSDAEIQSFFADYPDAAVRMKGQLTQEFDEVEESWHAMVAGMEGGPEALESFFDDAAAAGEEFREVIDTEFQAISDAVISGAPAWTEYERGVETSLEDARRWLSNYVQDVQSWAAIQDTVMEHASANTVAFLDSLSPQERGMLGELSTDELVAYIESVNEEMDKLAVSTGDIFQSRLPSIIEGATPELAAALSTMVANLESEYGLGGEMGGDAYREALQAAISDFPESMQADILAELERILGPEEFRALGFVPGDATSQGFADGLSTIADRAVEQINAAKTAVAKRLGTPDAAGGWGIGSPSKWMIKMGEYAGEGFAIGMGSGLLPVPDMIAPKNLTPSVMQAPAPNVNLQTESDRSIHLNVHGGNGSTEHEIKKAALYMSQIVHMVESPRGL